MSDNDAVEDGKASSDEENQSIAVNPTRQKKFSQKPEEDEGEDEEDPASEVRSCAILKSENDSCR